ncbi:MAG: DUF808 domain-containing protein, partial [Pseudomonas sp.]|nr:DUF808 domain-containing protein [Pseudomonas sp.]
PYIGSVLGGLVPTLLDALFGILAGAVILGVVTVASRVFGKAAHE